MSDVCTPIGDIRAKDESNSYVRISNSYIFEHVKY